MERPNDPSGSAARRRRRDRLNSVGRTRPGPVLIPGAVKLPMADAGTRRSDARRTHGAIIVIVVIIIIIEIVPSPPLPAVNSSVRPADSFRSANRRRPGLIRLRRRFTIVSYGNLTVRGAPNELRAATLLSAKLVVYCNEITKSIAGYPSSDGTAFETAVHRRRLASQSKTRESRGRRRGILPTDKSIGSFGESIDSIAPPTGSSSVTGTRVGQNMLYTRVTILRK